LVDPIILSFGMVSNIFSLALHIRLGLPPSNNLWHSPLHMWSTYRLDGDTLHLMFSQGGMHDYSQCCLGCLCFHYQRCWILCFTWKYMSSSSHHLPSSICIVKWYCVHYISGLHFNQCHHHQSHSNIFSIVSYCLSKHDYDYC
jgi:hypothetical protein